MIFSRRACRAAMLAGIAALAAPSGATRAQDGCGASYTVRPGDTLAGIAERCGTTAEALMAANALIEDPARITVGWELTVPGARASLGPEAEVRPAALGAEAEAALAAGSYEVRPGDSFASIATALKIPMRALMAANEGVDAFGLRPGQTLSVPRAEPAAQARPGESAATEGPEAETAGRGAVPNTEPGPPSVEPEADEGAGSDEAAPDPDMSASDPQALTESLLLQGEVLSGTECPVLKTPEGDLYSLVSAEYGFTPGDYVEIEGETVDLSFCMQGRTTVRVTSMTAVRAHQGG